VIRRISRKTCFTDSERNEITHIYCDIDARLAYQIPAEEGNENCHYNNRKYE
jgi:hypothetical protein